MLVRLIYQHRLKRSTLAALEGRNAFTDEHKQNMRIAFCSHKHLQLFQKGREKKQATKILYSNAEFLVVDVMNGGHDYFS